MSPGVPSLVLTPFGRKERILLVPPTAAVGLCHDGSHQAVPRRQLLAYWAHACRLDPMEVRSFLSAVHLSSLLGDLNDSQLFQYLQALIKDDVLVMVRACESAAEATPANVLQRRLLATLEKQQLSPFNHEGRRYKLVAGDALAEMSNRDDFEVVSRAEGIKVIESLAGKSSPASAKLLGEAGQQLTRDWRPPFRPDGLVLLKAIVKLQAAAPSPIAQASLKNAPGPREDEEELDLDQECQASTLANAAESGVPFCQECAS